LILLASAFELYVRRIVSISVQSDPGILILTPRSVDGVSLLKRNSLIDTKTVVKNCSDGVWSKRENAIRLLLGTSIPELHNNIKHLQSVQDVRNSVAHEFGRKSPLRDFWYLDPRLAKSVDVAQVSPKRLQELLGIVGAVAEAIDRAFARHVGSFELLLFWHNFQREHNKSTSAVFRRYATLYKDGGSEKLLSTHLHSVSGRALGRVYCEELIQHYASC
jgi:hypothetical protein